MVPLLRMASPAKDRIPPSLPLSTEWLTNRCKTSFAEDKIVGSCKEPWRVVRNVIFCHRVPLADPRSAGDVCHTLSPISFISMQFLAKILPNNRLAHPPLGLAHPSHGNAGSANDGSITFPFFALTCCQWQRKSYAISKMIQPMKKNWWLRQRWQVGFWCMSKNECE